MRSHGAQILGRHAARLMLAPTWVLVAGILGLLVYPALVAGGWLYVRLAERNEREFVDLVERS